MKHMKDTTSQKNMDALIQSLGERRPRLLLHSCCGPCSSYVLEYLSDYFDITLFFYNPNIQPAEEYEKRLSAQKQLLERAKHKNPVAFLAGEYEPQRFFEAVKGLENCREGGARCEKCFELRLSKAAEIAKKGGFDYFATTLTVSPHKNAVLINEIGGRYQNYLPSNFKKREGYKRSIILSKEYELYRQDYCGCIFSKGEKDI